MTTLKGLSAGKIGTSTKAAVVSVVFVANAFAWYLTAARSLTDIADNGGFSSTEVLVLWGLSIIAIAVSALFSVYISNQTKKRTSFLRYWMLAGIAISLLPLLFDLTQLNILTAFSVMQGIYFGLGMPACLAYFAASIKPENRARMGGLTFFAIFATVLLLRIFESESILLNAIVLASFKGIGLAIVTALKPVEPEIAKHDQPSYQSILGSRQFLLYFVPWTMFSVVNYMAGPIAAKVAPADFSQYYTLIENVLAGVFAVVSGFYGDRIGRKRLVVAAFTLVGLGYGSIGLFNENVYAWWFYTFADGIAWGAFYTLFLMTIWGDVAMGRSSEKYYALGSLPFLFSLFIQFSIANYVSSAVYKTAVFSFASLFLFLAILPLAYAPETLQNLRERELKSYVEKAKRLKLSQSLKT